jgi:hypothetical protein
MFISAFAPTLVTKSCNFRTSRKPACSYICHAKPLEEATERLDAPDRQHTFMRTALILMVGVLITGAWLVALGTAGLWLMDAMF